MEIIIGWLYPTLMSTYGDCGNVITIERRALWRGYNVKVVSLDQNTTAAEIKSVDIIVGGGATRSSAGNRDARFARCKS